MTKLKLSYTYLPLVFIFVFVNALCVIFNNKLDEWGIDHFVLQAANLLLFLLMIGSAYIHIRAFYKPNPHAFLRSVLSATVLKLFVIAGAAFIYLLIAGENRSTYAVLGGLLLYVVYTTVEMRGIFKMNKELAMARREHPMQALASFLPDNSFEQVIAYLHHYKVHLTISKARSTVLGDYRNAYAGKHHRISVNGNLNKFSFLITLLHELAHLLTFEKYKHSVAAHGKEWKMVYGGLLAAFIEHNLFPADIKAALLQSLQNPAASTCAEENLMRVLRNYDAPREGIFLLEQLPENALFVTKDGRQFIKGSRLRKRYRCKEILTGTFYLFSPVYEVRQVAM